MQYPPFSSPPIKGVVQKAFFHTSSTVTHTSHIHFKLEQPHFVRLLLQGYFFALHAYCLHSLLLVHGLQEVGLTFTTSAVLVVLLFFLQYYPEYLDPLSYHTCLHTSEAVPPLLAYFG